VSVWALAAEPAGVKLSAADDKVDFRIADALVGRYYTSPTHSTVAKPYIWPLNGPNGNPVTRGWPMEEKAPGGSTDHPHQKSVWFCHGDVIPEGLELTQHIKGVEGVDFWSEAKGHGRIVGKTVEVAGGRLTTQNDWLTADGRKVLDETRIIQLHNFGDTRLLVFDITLAANSVPVTFGDTKEGSFGIRINDAIREMKGKAQGDGKLENANGKVGEKDCWGFVSAWCDYSGPIHGKVVGLAILDDPKNPYPACWHSRGYGLMAANPFGRAKSGFPAMKGRTDLVHLAKGERLKLRYGLLIHPGDAKEGKVAEYFERFVKLRNGS
jgi:methane monooxygenase PmoA-like